MLAFWTSVPDIHGLDEHVSVRREYTRLHALPDT